MSTAEAGSWAFGLKDKLRPWLRYDAGELLQFAEDPEQRLAGMAQVIIDFPAAAVRLHEPCGLESQEVG